jgi:hypothetical protein
LKTKQKGRTKRREKQLKKVKQKRQQRQNETLVVMPQDHTQDIPGINYEAWLRAVAARDPKVWDAIVQYLSFFESRHYRAFGRSAIVKLNEFATAVMVAISNPDFRPNGNQSARLVQASHLFHHLVAISSFETTDVGIRNSVMQEGNVGKLVFLTNPRSLEQIHQEKFFEKEPYLASLWYLNYLLGISSPTPTMQKNIHRHLSLMSDLWKPPHHCLTPLYFGVTYHNPDAARMVKGKMNRAIKEIGKIPTFTNTPHDGDRPRIAVITNKWHRNHAVYKSQGVLLEQLLPWADLHLYWTGQKERMPDTTVRKYFKDVENCYFEQNGVLVIPDSLKNNNFDMVYYPDIGMTDESVWLSNCRIAPIQVVGQGHPDTTGDDSEIDYFIGGHVEKDAAHWYGETLVLIPGLAQEPAWPTADRKHNYKDDGIVRVNCVWGPDKYNHTLLSVLAEVNNRVREIDPESKHEFHLFGSPGLNRYAALPSFTFEVKKMLPNAIIHSEQEYYDYMENAEQHDFSLNSFPFGGYNTLVESLYMGLPFLTLVGPRFYNRAGAWLNEAVGMEQNTCQSGNDFITRATELITDPEELRWQRNYVASLDLKQRLFTLEGTHFLDAMRYIFDNHPFTETTLIGEANEETDHGDGSEDQEGSFGEETDAKADRQEV